MWIAFAPHLSRFSAELVGDSTVWWVNVDLYASNAEPGEIAAADVARAVRMTTVDDVIRVLGTRRALREILGDALECEPASLKFGTTSLGKPTLLNHNVSFNTSRSGPEALVGLNRTREIGVDIETVTELRHLDELCETALTDSERQSIGCERREDISVRFLIAWTRKEACMKALGMGLKLAPSALDVGCELDTRRIVTGEGPASRAVAVQSFRSPRNAVGAVACVID
jgi:4'-phosphopantetheinyl transferase